MTVKLTTHKNGLKMEKFLSLNVALCEFCDSMRANKDCICSQCYAYYMSCRYKRLREMLKENSKELSSRVFTDDECAELVKPVNSKEKILGLRFDSLGELINEIHVMNLQNIAHKVTSKPVTLWTKRPALLFKVISKPAFKVIYSNPLLNSFVSPEVKDSRICHTFNVYSDKNKMFEDIDQAQKMGLNTQVCHGKCKECMVCYNHNSTRKVIFELTKKAASKEN